MAPFLFLLLMVAFAVVIGLLLAPVQKRPELIPIRIRHDDTTRRPPRR
ncbi:hypothetical protein [Paludibacterium denitrificans]|uniref:Uncharacterized protein n=1 Tax=Paludibacterium denitrificans TaxID=2675226 RepID=A0A844G9M9_9NEIS|nr:hypothetical protein [Paludibacterium denitrificans]MTD32339.1 hypothetical protein [Paludibacterium denitrificans]HJV06633.1 hypothetical protein [Chromobacteriaceae bacterium]